MVTPLNVIVAVLTFLVLTFNQSKAQSIVQVGTTVEFGGTVVSVDERGRQQLQREVNQLYADRAALNSQLEQLRQLDPLMEPIFRQVSLPVDFRHLALPLQPANSYWNIPASLVSDLGLQVDQVVDERYHPIQTTEAAVAYLARLQARKANALRVLIDYLQPPTAAPVERLRGNNTYAVLDADSSEVVWKVLARRLVFNHEEPAFRPNRTFLLYTHEGSAGQTLSDIAFQYNVPTDRLQPFNRWLRGDVLPAQATQTILVRLTPDEYAAAIGRVETASGAGKTDESDNGFPVLRRLAPMKSVLNTPLVLYEINTMPGIQAQPGDNIITLAYYGNVSIKRFMAYNDMTDRDVVRPGEIYYLAPKARRAKVPFHVVERGQTMRDVANRYGVRLKYLLRYNDIEPNQRVLDGRVLWLQRARPKDQPIEYRQPTTRPVPPASETRPDQPPVEPALTDSLQAQPTPGVSIGQDSLALNETDTSEVASRPESVSGLDAEADEDVASKKGIKLHTVERGQTYYAISRLYGVTVGQLYDWNNLSERIPLRIGQQLIVDMSDKTTKPRSAKPRRRPARPSSDDKMVMRIEVERLPGAPKATPKRAPAQSRQATPYYHVVKPGQTVYRVALINKVTVEQVMQWNNLRDYTIEVGQRLLIKK